jgi:hypothetical protein
MDDWYCEWLYTPAAEEGKPRVLVLSTSRIKLKEFIPFVQRVKKVRDIHNELGNLIFSLLLFPQDFVQSNQAISFFIHIFRQNARPIESLSLENYQTQEKLVIRGEDGHATISRCPMRASEEWIEEMGEYSDWESRKIVIDF